MVCEVGLLETDIWFALDFGMIYVRRGLLSVDCVLIVPPVVD